MSVVWSRMRMRRTKVGRSSNTINVIDRYLRKKERKKERKKKERRVSC